MSELKQWLEGLGIDGTVAERYAQGLAHPDFLYTQVSQLISDPLSHEDLTRAGVNALLHRNWIIRAVKDLKRAASGDTLSPSARPQGPPSLALSNNFFSLQLTTIDLEGLKTTPWALQRNNLCNTLLTLVNANNRLLVRGPFASGKTSLAQLLHHHLSQSGKRVYIVTAAVNNVDWGECWFRQTQVPWVTIATSTEPTYVIIDEVQHTYPPASRLHDLWSSIKGLIGMTAPVRFICIGSYGDLNQGTTTPVDFDTVVSLRPHNDTPGMAYTQEEFQQLCTLFQQRGGFEIDERSANYIFHMTGGHPGTVGLVLKHVCKKLGSNVAAVHGLYDYLHSVRLHNSLNSNRAIPDFSAYQTISDICKHVLNGESFKVPKSSFTGDRLAQLHTCLKASVLVEDGDLITFASPIVQSRALAFYFSETQDDPVSLDAFIIAVVQRFSVRQLRNTESKDTKSRIMEGQWQQEFSRAAASLLPPDVIMSPEYGREQGAKGQVDFYVAKYKWLIEILREGIGMSAHERRFESGGQYAPLLPEGQQRAVIDLCSTGKEVQPHTYHVSFNDKFTSVVIIDPVGNEQQLIKFV